MVLLVEHGGEGVTAPRSRITLGLGHPFIKAHRFSMFGFHMNARQASHICSITAVSAILGRSPGIIALFTELGSQQPFKPGTFLLAVYGHLDHFFRVALLSSQNQATKAA